MTEACETLVTFREVMLGMMEAIPGEGQFFSTPLPVTVQGGNAQLNAQPKCAKKMCKKLRF